VSEELVGTVCRALNHGSMMREIREDGRDEAGCERYDNFLSKSKELGKP